MLVGSERTAEKLLDDEEATSVLLIIRGRYRVIRSQHLPEGETGEIEKLPERMGWNLDKDVYPWLEDA